METAYTSPAYKDTFFPEKEKSQSGGIRPRSLGASEFVSAYPDPSYHDYSYCNEPSFTIDQLDHNRREHRLSRVTALLDSKMFEALAPGGESVVKPRRHSVASAKRLLQELPKHIPVPNVCPDEEGDVEMHWHGAPDAIVIIEENRLHAVFSPNTDCSKHLHDIPFDDGVWPREIIALLTNS